jgi:hypothetical protein
MESGAGSACWNKPCPHAVSTVRKGAAQVVDARYQLTSFRVPCSRGISTRVLKLCLTWLDDQPGPLAVRSLGEEKPAPICQPQQHPVDQVVRLAVFCHFNARRHESHEGDQIHAPSISPPLAASIRPDGGAQHTGNMSALNNQASNKLADSVSWRRERYPELPR